MVKETKIISVFIPANNVRSTIDVPNAYVGNAIAINDVMLI